MMRRVPTTCPYCGVGCGIVLNVDDSGRIAWVDDDPANLSSMGMLCVKGRFGATFVSHPDRLTTPLVRRDGALRPATWDEALDLVARRLPEFRGRFGSFASAKATNEDAFVQQKFVRLLMGTNNIDHCTRLCHSPSVEAMLQQLGSGATSNSYADFEAAGCVVVIGCDPGSNHPVIASRIRRAVDVRGVRLVVVNPKRIDLCDRAEVFLQPQPGADVALFNGMAREILDSGLEDRDFVASRTEGYAAWHEAVMEMTVEQHASLAAVEVEALRAAAHLIARPPEPAGHPDGERPGTCLLWGMGITQHTQGTANAHALINLALLTGHLGRPGAGISPLRGQNNVQGCGDSGCIPDSLPGYQRLDEQNMASFEAAWGAALPREPGLKATDMIERILSGEIRAMYIVGENPLLSEPNLHHATEAIRGLEFLVVQDIFLHETAALADVVLPACSFAEKEGTFTNSERRVQRVRPALPPTGESRPDWEVICDLARRMGPGAGVATAEFAYSSAADVFDELARLTPFLRGMSHERLDREGGLQWPCPTPEHPGSPVLYGESFPRGRGLFVAVRQGGLADEETDDQYPLVLNTGRILYHWHGGTLTRRVRGLLEQVGTVPVAIHPGDAGREGIEPGSDVTVLSRRGRLRGVAVVTDAVRPGSIFVPFVKLNDSAANFLTNNVYDPQSRIPEYKVCAVRIESGHRARRRDRDATGASGPEREAAVDHKPVPGNE
ncbi:formate dehydrogenase subunit alpha [bacterium]|nr:MAG: formate dehydrogenase subunit alpha [bacterium]MCL4230284.1 formate dehydrogenase subunit alpha [Dehalococcoidia bacterium]